MPSVLSDKKWCLDDNLSDNNAHRKSKKNKEKKQSRPHCPQVSHFFSER